MAPIRIDNQRAQSYISADRHSGSETSNAARLNAPLFRDRFDAVLWRPISSGRAKSKVWVQSMLRPAVNLRRATPEARRANFRAYLVEEDVTHPTHPNMCVPKECVQTPYAYRLWPDKVQALFAFDQTLPGRDVPALVTGNRYAPVGLHKPRLTVTRVMPHSGGGYDLTFAETPDTLHLVSLSDEMLRFSKRRDKNARALRMQGVAKLHAMAELFADPERAQVLSRYIETLRVPLRPELADPLEP